MGAATIAAVTLGDWERRLVDWRGKGEEENSVRTSERRICSPVVKDGVWRRGFWRSGLGGDVVAPVGTFEGRICGRGQESR